MSNVLYLAVVDDIKKKIISGELSPNDMLNSESELMKEYNVSRMTLRKSLSLLSNQGYIYSIQGKGNFVRKPNTDLYQFRFNEYDSLFPEVDEIKLLSVTIDTASGQVKTDLQLNHDDQVVRIEKLMLSTNEPIAFEILHTQYFANKPVVEDQINFSNYSRTLETKLAFAIKKELEIRIVKAGQYSNRLDLTPDDDVFQISKKTINKDTRKPLTTSIILIKKEFFVITAGTPEEDEVKKIF